MSLNQVTLSVKPSLLLNKSKYCNNAKEKIYSCHTYIYNLIIDKVNVAAGRAVHVGDDEVADKIGAEAVGIDCW